MHVGILGGGQLGRMIALAGYPLGVRCSVLDPADDPCAAHVGGHVQGEFDDYRSLYEFIRGLDVVTYEFENVPVETVRWLAERLPVYPSPDALAVAQDRLAEKRFFTSLGIGVPAFAAIDSRADTVPAIIDELSRSRTSERQGRAIDHGEASMERKKVEGYF